VHVILQELYKFGTAKGPLIATNYTSSYSIKDSTAPALICNIHQQSSR
jgi:hypothetical protein